MHNILSKPSTWRTTMDQLLDDTDSPILYKWLESIDELVKNGYYDDALTQLCAVPSATRPRKHRPTQDIIVALHDAMPYDDA